MGVPIAIVQGVIFIADANGNIVGQKRIGTELDASSNALYRVAADAVIEGVLDDTSTTAATEDLPAPVRITAQRALHTNLRDSSGNEFGTSGHPTRVDPTGTTTQPVSGTFWQGTQPALTGKQPPP